MAAQRSAGAAANAGVVGMNRSGQVQVFQSTPEPDVEAGLKQQQAKALSEQRAAQAALGRRTDELVAKQLQPQLAFERFAGKVFDPAASVQSQLRALSSTRTEFAALHAVGSANQSNFESPLERYYRLQHELKAFQSDLDALVRAEQHAKQSADQVKAITDVSVLLSADLKTLETELNGMAQNKAFAAFLTPGAGAAAAALAASSVGGATGALNAALQSVRDRKDDKKQTPVTAADRPVLEIYSGAGISSASPEQLQQLDKRLALIEKLVGGPEAASSSFPDIQTGLKALGKKLELLDAQRLDSLYRRVKGVLTELETLEAVKKEKLAAGAVSPAGDGKDKRDAAAEEKIEQLYTLMTRWDTAAQSLPVVVARLQSLKEVHDECAGVALRLQSVEKTADAAQKTLDDDRSALATLTKNFASNMSVIQSNVTSLEARFTTLQSKMDQLAKLKIVS